MSHQILDNMIAWKNEVPWQGLGYEVPANATGAEMLKIAKLDWRVQRRSIAMRSGDSNDRQKLLVDPLRNFRAIVRADNDYVFQVAKKLYMPVQNEEIVEFFREFCEAGHASMETVGGLNGGGIVWALARLNSGTTTKLQDVDELRGYLLLATSHTGQMRTIGKATQTRVVCWNTLSAALSEKNKQFAMKHTRKFDEGVKAEAKAIMGMAIEQVQKTNELSAKLAKVTLTTSDRVQFLRTLLNIEKKEDEQPIEPSKQQVDDALAFLEGQITDADLKSLGKQGQDILEAIYQSPGAKLPTADGTLWGVVNGVTYYADHMRSRSQDLRLQNAWFGATDKLKIDAMNLALQMAGVNV